MTSESTRLNRSVWLCLLLGFLLPQITLVALNFHGWLLIAGEAGQPERYTALFFLCFELILIFACAAVCGLYAFGKIKIGWLIPLVSLAVHVAYMLIFLFYSQDIIPDTVQPWILHAENVGRWNITLFMPGTFLSLYALSKAFFSNLKVYQSTLFILVGTIGMPAAWYVFVTLIQPIWLGDAMIIISIIVAAIMVIVFLGAVIRLFDFTINNAAFARVSANHYIIAGLLGLGAPLVGLILNKQMPLPSDLQITEIYILTVINGLILIIKPEGSGLAALKLFLRCTAFPIIAYFFLMFLPFLPLSLIAVLAFGLGFLFLTPLALGLFQARVTFLEFTSAVNQIGKSKAIGIGIIGLLVIPAYIFSQALMDKHALNAGLEYFYSHDTTSPVLSSAQRKRTAKTLVKIRDRKQGAQLPYISAFYNAVVFGDLVLSDQKISRLYKLLTNAELPETKMPFFGFRAARSRFRLGGTVAPDRDVHISRLEHTRESPVKATVKLKLKNSSTSTHVLYVDTLHLPEGVFVTGLRLKIEGEWVTGRIFDRKTALWVFEKITEVRRDPALLYYTTPTTAELRVYPFPSNGIREVEIDFAYHPQMDGRISIGQREVDLNPEFNRPSVVSEGGAMLLGKGIKEAAFIREPYIHFILDYAEGSKINARGYAEKMVRICQQLKISQFRISAANISVSRPDENALLNDTDPERIAQHIDTIRLAETGGLWLQMAIAKEILNIQTHLTPDTLNRVPVFVVVSGRHEISAEKVELHPWIRLIPDMQAWYVQTVGNLQSEPVKRHRLNRIQDKKVANAVIALKRGTQIAILPADDSSILETGPHDEVQVFIPAKNQFVPLSPRKNINITNSSWPVSAGVWAKWRRLNLNPSAIEANRTDMLNECREHSLLLPLSAFIVVESASQWEILDRKEKQSLDNNSGLDFEEEQQTPEPPWWLLMGCLLLYLYIRRKRQSPYAG